MCVCVCVYFCLCFAPDVMENGFGRHLSPFLNRWETVKKRKKDEIRCASVRDRQNKRRGGGEEGDKKSVERFITANQALNVYFR